MNWPRYAVEYGEIVAITLMMISVMGAIAIVLRGFQARRLRRNMLSGGGIVLCSLCIFASLQYMRIAPQKMVPLKPVFQGIGQRAPDLVYLSLQDGSRHHVAELAGKVVVLNVWATSCPASQAELPDLNRLQQAYGDRLVVLTITDEDADTVEKYTPLATMIVRKGLVRPGTDEGLFVPPDVARPVTHIIDANGVLRETLVGQQSFQQFETQVIRYLLPPQS
jgi:thiol-disulfide isomerase/thioredoxin